MHNAQRFFLYVREESGVFFNGDRKSLAIVAYPSSIWIHVTLTNRIAVSQGAEIRSQRAVLDFGCLIRNRRQSVLCSFGVANINAKSEVETRWELFVSFSWITYALEMIATDKGDRIYTGRVITSGGLVPWSPFGHIRVCEGEFWPAILNYENTKKIDVMYKMNVRILRSVSYLSRK